jgi:hypothetical protein
MFRDFDPGGTYAFSNEVRDQPRNPLAFVHEELNLVAAQTMSKPAGITFPEGKRAHHRSRIKE